jgi:transcriptional repressor NrdR
MVCIYCRSSTQVANSRLQKRLNQVWRRRRCVNCGNTFTTHEIVDLGSSVVVRHPGGELTPFSRDALFVSIYESCKHRPDALSCSNALAQTVTGQLRDHISAGTLERDVIANVAATAVERFDPAAGVMYRAYHPTR